MVLGSIASTIERERDRRDWRRLRWWGGSIRIGHCHMLLPYPSSVGIFLSLFFVAYRLSLFFLPVVLLSLVFGH